LQIENCQLTIYNFQFATEFTSRVALPGGAFDFKQSSEPWGERMIEVKKDFTRRELLWFGPLFALFVGTIGAILIRRFDLVGLAYGLWVVSAAIIVVYYLVPSIRTPTYRAWILSVMPIGWVVSHVLLAIVYYVVLTPIGLILRILRYDPLQRHFDPSAPTYWIEREPHIDSERYFRQF
jgi:hypothetical protein